MRLDDRPHGRVHEPEQPPSARPNPEPDDRQVDHRQSADHDRAGEQQLRHPCRRRIIDLPARRLAEEGVKVVAAAGRERGDGGLQRRQRLWRHSCGHGRVRGVGRRRETRRAGRAGHRGPMRQVTSRSNSIRRAPTRSSDVCAASKKRGRAVERRAPTCGPVSSPIVADGESRCVQGTQRTQCTRESNVSRRAGDGVGTIDGLATPSQCPSDARNRRGHGRCSL